MAQVNTVAELKASNVSTGEIIQTNGYYAAGDNGHGLYQVINSGTADEGYIIALNNGLYAKLVHHGTIYARQYGVKLDGTTDDTAALNRFFKMFGQAELIIDNGIARITNQLLLKGLWRPDTGNNGYKRLVFKRASIKYDGPPNRACMQIYNHQLSEIDGLSITRDSTPTHVNFAAIWYSKISNFDIPKITFNVSDETIPTDLITNDSYTNVLDKGYTEEIVFDKTGGGSFNSMSFYDVLFNGKYVKPYNLSFYGNGFQNFSFYNCDLSYSTKATLYINTQQTSSMFLNFFSCYFDSGMPLIENHHYKDANVNVYDSMEASGSMNQLSLVKTENFLSMERQGTIGNEPNSLPKSVLNLAKNGDFFSQDFTIGDWVYDENTTTGGRAEKSFVSNPHTINGTAMKIRFTTTTQNFYFRTIPLPFKGKYSVGIRLKKISGSGTLELYWDGKYKKFNISNYANGEELILSTFGNGTKLNQGTVYNMIFKAVSINAPITVEILEIICLAGSYISFNLPMHPKAIVYPKFGNTSQRPTSPRMEIPYIDTQLGKPVWWIGGSWKNSDGSQA